MGLRAARPLQAHAHRQAGCAHRRDPPRARGRPLRAGGPPRATTGAQRLVRLAATDDLEPGGVLSTIAASRELVVYRGLDGSVGVLDAHCPHLGGHLGGGEVRDGTLSCPYHGWQFDRAGDCVEIPYSDGRIPSRACVRSYPVRETNDMILFWYHVAGAEPGYEVPGIEEPDDPAFGEVLVHRGEFTASLQDMAENNVDYTHFHFVHRREALDASTSRFSTDGPFSEVVETFPEENLTFTRWTYGPGIALLRVPGLMTVLSATTPIDRRHVRLLWHFHLPTAMMSVADEIVEGVVGPYGLGADQPIWRDKVFRERPVLVKGDGPVAEFRRWYEQFYEGHPGRGWTRRTGWLDRAGSGWR
ncbi:MAG: Rieske 2Fe-2S domain-containing protein [Microthrixaceae bacterium]